ncbi:hypothetical protein GCM10009737_10110 [Nocardioides lentus]|uniref:DUF4760 domain-containing protein n=1 Tax=Nocardioides lentus TaxID=338077 RepID=A0ABP5ADT8_9ACTN
MLLPLRFSSLATDAAQVPTWLQILTLTLAPVLGFVGVGVGALLQSRSNKRAKLRDDRRATYLTFAKTVHEFYQWFGLEGTKSADHRAGADFAGHLAHIKTTIGAIESLGYEVDLIASKGAADAGRKCMQEVVVSQAIWMNAVLTKSFDRVVWSKCYFDGSEALRTFRDAAMKDLGVSRRDRRRPEIETPDHAQIEDGLAAYRKTFPWLDAVLRGEESTQMVQPDMPNPGSKDPQPTAHEPQPSSGEAAGPDNLKT